MTLFGPALAWLITLAIEVPTVALMYSGQRTRMALVAALATSATNLPMNLLLPAWLGSGSAFLLTGELGALVLEAVVYFLAARPRDLPRAATASALANALSFGAGLLLVSA